jgi:alkane 1-monooxygenase
MNLKKLKYLLIFLLPITVAVSFVAGGILSFLPAFVFFVLVPLLETILPSDSSNLSEEERLKAEKDPFYDWLIYLLVPLQYGFLVYYLTNSIHTEDNLTLLGRTISMGVMCGVIGINVGHELGHRLNRTEQFLGELLLLSSLENHFLPYHNRGHHTNVGTPDDPATARKNEPLYFFWIRSHFGSYRQAWQIEFQRMRIMKLPTIHWKNKMVMYTLAQFLLLSVIWAFLGIWAMLCFIMVSGIGILLLETVNYIEHYGLYREKRESGSYERVRRAHSWTSNHVLGRAILFELSRHSDHHYKADRPYQLLEHHDESPQMPAGYPGMMLMAFVPPLFFSKVNPIIEKNKA